MQLLIGNDHTVTVTGLHDAITGDYINTATVTVTITDKRGNVVTGQSMPLTLAYIADSNGNYQGNLEDGLNLTEDRYLVEVQAVGDGDLVALWHQWITACYRKLDD
jgi:hypothetical protein